MNSLLYQCGVFQGPDTPIVGYYAVEIVDYGNVSGIDFWVVKNSW